MKHLLLFIVLLFLTVRIALESPPRNEFIVWNVGQGLWTTWVNGSECWHFDMGGEYKKIIRRVDAVCATKVNRISLSHWDMDHIGFLKYVKKKSWKLCLDQKPGGVPNTHKLELTEGLKPCEKRKTVRNLWDADAGDPQLKLKNKNRSNNHDSHVFELLQNRILVTGDSTVDEEKIWSRRITVSIYGLILGHHGSHTSTSDELLDRLPDLRWAVASQRFSRYGHPHRIVVAKLAKRKIPLLKTEDWGTLHFIE